MHTLDDLLQAVAKLGDGDAAKLRMVDLQVKFNTFLSSKVSCADAVAFFGCIAGPDFSLSFSNENGLSLLMRHPGPSVVVFPQG